MWFYKFERQLIFFKAVPSIVNPVNKLYKYYSLAYKVQQTFFVPAKQKIKNKCTT